MQGFDITNPPFDRLTHQEGEELRAGLDVGYFAPEEEIIARGGSSDWLRGGRDGGRPGQPPGLVIRSSTTVCTTAPTSSSGSRLVPSSVTLMTTGQMRRVRSGPPVAESSSAAS